MSLEKYVKKLQIMQTVSYWYVLCFMLSLCRPSVKLNLQAFRQFVRLTVFKSLDNDENKIGLFT